MNHNPTLLTPDQLAIAPPSVILVGIYELLLASITFAFSLLFFYWVFKFAVWFFPKFYHKSKESGRDA